MSLPSTNRAIQGLGFNHISITTHKMDESLRFYRDLLGMPVVAELRLGERRLYQLDIGDGTLIEICDPSEQTKNAAPGVVPINHIGFVTADITAAVERVRGAGYPVTDEPRHTGPGPIQATVAFVQGPNGESIEFMQMD